MQDTQPTTPVVIRLATPEDILLIEELDSFSSSPIRNIPREMEKYFGSVDPSIYEQTLIFLAEVAGIAAGKAELMLPPTESPSTTGYVKRVIVRPDFRKQGLARSLMQHIITFAQTERHLETLDLHVWEKNLPAIRLYEELGFELKHRELYFRLHLS